MIDDYALVRRAKMRWNTPLDEAHAELLLQRLDVQGGTVVDLGCGWGELLIRAVDGTAARGIGIDVDEVALDRGRKAATERGAAVEFVEQAAAEWRGTADRAICIGALHTEAAREIFGDE
ncbi:class I SAM-dependent methyltransferase [Amycolatopsis sp. NBC_00345]|uniref:SAM-dependent methyltransferase n=1 Tax=Amycolatopsis sp. NBC_00345 TaxID=2975955 RepID=UPI002E27056C